MRDELDARIRSLEAERLRPVRPRPEQPAPAQITPAALAELLEEAARIPEDEVAERRQSAGEAREEDYAFMRGNGASVAEAAARLGVSETHALKRYEPIWRQESA